MFKIDSGVKQGYIMSPWLFNIYFNTVMKEVKMGMERRGDYLSSGKKMAWFCVVSRRRT